MLDTLKENYTNKTVALLAVGFLLITVLIVGFLLAPPSTMSPDQDNTTQTDFNSTPVSTDNLTASHKQATLDSTNHTVTLTAQINNQTQYQEETIVTNETIYSVTNDTTGVTEIWQVNNTTYAYSPSDGTVTEPTDVQFDDRRSKARFVQRVLDAGDFWYTSETTFELRNVSDTRALLFAYPTISGQTNGEVRNVSITGTIEDGVVTELTGEFDFYPPVENAQPQQYSFTLTVTETTVPPEEPSWLN